MTTNRRRAVGRLLAATQAAAMAGTAWAQGSRRPGSALPAIGFLSPFSRADSERARRAFVAGMQERGLVADRDYAIVERYADADPALLEAAARELAAGKVAQIVALTTPAADAARRVSGSLPIVFVGVADDEIPDFANSLSRPGRNVTGLGMYAAVAPSVHAEAPLRNPPVRGLATPAPPVPVPPAPAAAPAAVAPSPGASPRTAAPPPPPRFTGDLNPKRIELLKRALPRLTHVVLLVAPGPRDGAANVLLDQSARASGLQLDRATVARADHVDVAIDPIAANGTAALLVSSSASHYGLRARIAERALARRIPSMFAFAEGAEAGGLMSYGADMLEMCRGAAAYADKILKGASPAELPIEMPRRLELVLNLRTAATLGIAFPTSIVVQAARTLE